MEYVITYSPKQALAIQERSTVFNVVNRQRDCPDTIVTDFNFDLC